MRVDERFGLGFDVHSREISRKLRLAGVEFPDEPGLAGHSDADVVCHALADAILGAAGLGDLGQHFPDDDPSTSGMAGTDLLSAVVAKAAEAGVLPASCDITLIADRPKIADHRDEMRKNLATALGVDVSRVSLKATRPEGLGLRGDGAGCIALAMLTGA